MGCQCCRMIKSYIYDPSDPVDVQKSDPAGSTLYQSHPLPGNVTPRSAHNPAKKGFHNLGYITSNAKHNDGTLKLEADNNHINRLRAVEPSPQNVQGWQGKARSGEGGPYIIQPQGPGDRWGVPPGVTPSQVPVYPNIHSLERQRESLYENSDTLDGRGRARHASEHSLAEGVCGGESSSVDEGVGGTPDYLCDTGDEEESVLSGDVHTSTTSLSSADAKDERRPRASTPERSLAGTKSEDEGEGGEEDAQSVTDSMVAEALAALDSATAGEDYD
ncbi:uncharacterized protein zgc:194930 [Hypomesus transpacificus]|uniref:uncharacterized protein zgc:194930 n=1 Tax=Hypomesus transpacificus TaxID=137520 RepID=UPI001F072559|nr:uncharacterized protein zgc:194930 [Hypomesus transpacificus]